MTDFLIYDLKVAVLVAVFYMFYRLLLSRDALHRLNRLVLLSTSVASFVLPLCVITLHSTVVLPLATVGASAPPPLLAAVEPSQPWWQRAAVALFLAGVAATLFRLLWSVGQVVRLIRHSERHPQADGIVVCVTGKDVPPFSWMRYIVLNRKDYESPDPAVMAHERGHIRQRHSLDVLLVDTLTVVQWFNPAMWMLRQDLRAIHEYEADQAVLSQGINVRQYQYLLIQKAVAACGYSVANGITHSTLKKRITMMLNNKKSSRAGTLKLLALLPIVGIALALQAETVTDYVYEQPQKKAVKKGRKAGQIKVGAKTIEVQTDSGTLTGENGVVIITTKAGSTDGGTTLFLGKAKVDSTGIRFKEAEIEDTPEYEKIFDVVEQMPEFPGGSEGLMTFLMENVRYPEAAHKAQTQGRVLVTFVVEADGRVSNAKVVKRVSDDLDGEAVRVVGSMPRWKPGTQNGKPVRVRYTMPVTFRLN